MQEFLTHPLATAAVFLAGLAVIALALALLSAWRDNNPRPTLRRRDTEDSPSRVLAD